MGQKVFSKRVLRNPDLKRNSIDLSRINHLTTKIGQLTPVFLQEVVPGDSFNIKCDFGFRFMPMAFPVQTPIRADIHFFYVRTRTLWDNFTSFRFNTIPNIQHPYIHTNDTTFFSNGSLADYLGIPTSQYQSESEYQVVQRLTESECEGINPNPYAQGNAGQIHTWIHGPDGGQAFTIPTSTGLLFLRNGVRYELGHNLSEYIGTSVPMMLYSTSLSFTEDTNSVDFYLRGRSDVINNIASRFDVVFYTETHDIKNNIKLIGKLVNITSGASETEQLGDSVTIKTQYYSASQIITEAGIYRDSSIKEFLAENDVRIGIIFNNVESLLTETIEKEPVMIDLSALHFGVKTAQEVPVHQSPFAIVSGTNSPRIPISALPFRAYEACYNSFYRNTIVSPFKKTITVNGVVEEREVFDDYVTNKGDGADSTQYRLYQRNWEKDVFTSAWKTPQFGGSQPLIGATSSEQPFQVQQMVVKEGTSTTQKTLNIMVQDDRVVGLSHYNTNFPMSTIEALESAIKYGISINDLRNTDALQIWLENNIANGFKYKDEMLSHFGVNVDFSILSMPEYIGGVSKHLNMNTIYQSIETTTDPLGSFAGVGNIMGQTKYDINKYCEEDGFIIGILSLVPVPAYSQLLPRVFQKKHFLDYFNPEFSHIGMQPIYNKDLSPLTTTLETQDKVFGYTKPNWEYLQSTDEIHGDFRDKLRNFVINREFSNVPALVQDFIEIKPTEVNDIFSYRENTDKIVGMISFACSAKRPISVLLNPQIK